MKTHLGHAVERGGRRERNAIAAHEALLAAACSVMGEKGISQARIEDITAEAGMAKGSFYAHFKDRDELVAAVVSRVVEELDGLTDPLLLKALNVADRARLLVNAQLSYFELQPGRITLLHQARGQLLQDDGAFPKLAKALAALERGIAHGLAAGAARKENHVLAARLVTALILGYAAGQARESGSQRRQERHAVANAAAAVVHACGKIKH